MRDPASGFDPAPRIIASCLRRTNFQRGSRWTGARNEKTILRESHAYYDDRSCQLQHRSSCQSQSALQGAGHRPPHELLRGTGASAGCRLECAGGSQLVAAGGPFSTLATGGLTVLLDIRGTQHDGPALSHFRFNLTGALQMTVAVQRATRPCGMRQCGTLASMQPYPVAPVAAAVTNAPCSISGARFVLTSSAEGFIRARSSALTTPGVDSTRRYATSVCDTSRPAVPSTTTR